MPLAPTRTPLHESFLMADRRDPMVPADQMQFANIVKECYETTVFPVPLNAIEHLINRIMDIVVQRRSLAPSSLDDDSSHTTLNWGRHYTWPASSLPFQLEMAMRKVQVKKETEKALRKAKGGGGDYMQ
jgi:hypothetical protein